MNVIINGKNYNVKSSMLFEILESHKISLEKVAVELDGVVVPKSSIANTQVQDGSKIEIITFVGGG